MSATSTMMLIGVGGAGCAMADKVYRLFGEDMRRLLIDTDASSGIAGTPFVLLGAERYAGRGAGGEVTSARTAAEDTVKLIEEHIGGVRLAVVVTALGGGTGTGATYEVIKHLGRLGIPSIAIATTPFSFEGEARHRNARGMVSMIADAANASIFMPLDKLVQHIDNMDLAMKSAVEAIADAVTLFWRLVEKPGYIRLDVERIRKTIQGAGRGRFMALTATGPNRAAQIVEKAVSAPLLADGTQQVRSILCGVLAGDDLRLSEIGKIADGIKTAFGSRADFELATVNDEAHFGGKISVVAMMFEAVRKEEPQQKKSAGRRQRMNKLVLTSSRFNNSEPTIWNGENLDVPTYIRQDINLEF